MSVPSSSLVGWPLTMLRSKIISTKSENLLQFVFYVTVVSIVRCHENYLQSDRHPRQLSSIFGNLFGHGHGHSNNRESEGRYGRGRVVMWVMKKISIWFRNDSVPRERLRDAFPSEEGNFDNFLLQEVDLGSVAIIQPGLLPVHISRWLRLLSRWLPQTEDWLQPGRVNGFPHYARFI